MKYQCDILTYCHLTINDIDPDLECDLIFII